MLDLRPASRPTMHFIGVTTGSSSIMRIFPRWARELALGDCELKGVDLPLRAPAQDFRSVVSFIKRDPLSLGALVTTHKLDIVAAAGDLIDELDPHARALGEASCLSKQAGRLIGHAKDGIASDLALAAILPENHWRASGGAAFLIGAGGAALAISSCLAEAERGNRPRRLVISDRDPARLKSIAAAHQRLGYDLPIDYVLAAEARDNASALARLPPRSLVVNATGMGKDVPGSPLPDGAPFPEGAYVWELNYRGALVFLDQARAQSEARGLAVHDGWIYFLHGWMLGIGEVFHVAIPPRGPTFEALARLAADARG